MKIDEQIVKLFGVGHVKVKNLSGNYRLLGMTVLGDLVVQNKETNFMAVYVVSFVESIDLKKVTVEDGIFKFAPTKWHFEVKYNPYDIRIVEGEDVFSMGNFNSLEEAKKARRAKITEKISYIQDMFSKQEKAYWAEFIHLNKLRQEFI